MVRLKAKPHSVWQPMTGTKYVADGEGFFDAAADHVKVLLKAGCARVAT